MIEKDILPLNEIERLERELRQLKEKYDKLYKENQNLKADDARILKDVIERKKFNYLFSYDINETGNIVNGSEYIANTNFTKLYKCLLGTIKPYAKLERERYFLRTPNFSDLTQTEWTILRVLTEKVLNEMVMAKIMIDDKETHTEDDVRRALENAYDVRVPYNEYNKEITDSVVETFRYDEEALEHEKKQLSFIINNMQDILRNQSKKDLHGFAKFIHEPYQRLWDIIICHGKLRAEKNVDLKAFIYNAISVCQSDEKYKNIWDNALTIYPNVTASEFIDSQIWLKQELLKEHFRPTTKKHYHRDYEVYHEEQ